MTILVFISAVLNVALLAALFILMAPKGGKKKRSGNGASKKSAERKKKQKNNAPKKRSAEPSEKPIGNSKTKTDSVCRIQHFTPDEHGLLFGLTVLVVDDDQTNIDVLVGMLEILGLTALATAHNGEQAVEYARLETFDIIYMDIQMPKKTGIEAATEIRAVGKNRTTPIIPITGFSRIVNSQMCEDAGMNGFLQKPVDLNLLEETTKKVLQNRGNTQAA